jgi:hypothetical protein
LRNNIILRDLPKRKVQIDLWPFDIHGGFRGFQNVPDGLHYIAVSHEQSYPGCWAFVQGETLVKVFDYKSASFVEADDETKTDFQQLADSGAMNPVLIQYPELAVQQWYRLTSHITPGNFSPIQTFRAADLFRKTIPPNDLVASYQWAFLKVIVVHPENLDAQDKQDWVKWVQAVCSANSGFVYENRTFCHAFLDLLTLHLKLSPAAYKPETDSMKIRATEFSNQITMGVHMS